MSLKRWSTLLLAVWILMAQFMAPLVHAHVGGAVSSANAGLHIHITAPHLSPLNNNVSLATAIDHVLLDKLSFGVEMPQGVRKDSVSSAGHDTFWPPQFMGILPALSTLPTALISRNAHSFDAPPPLLKKYSSAAIPRAPPRTLI